MSDLRGHSGPKIVAVTNQKGGVGKTTTTINLGAAMAALGMKVLIIDLDPQGNASTVLGIALEERTLTTYDLLSGEAKLGDLLFETQTKGLHIIPATVDLSSADVELYSDEQRSFLLRNALRQAHLAPVRFDYILIDCPPSLNLLTVNALMAAHSVLVPLQAEFFALEGLSQLMLTIREIRQVGNANLRIEGVLLTMIDNRNRLSQQVEHDARETLGEVVFKTTIPRNVRVSEAPSYAMPVTSYDPASRGASAYRDLAEEVLGNNKSVQKGA